MGLLPALPCQLRSAHPFSPEMLASSRSQHTPSTSLATDLSCFDKHPAQPSGLWLFRVPSFMWLGTNALVPGAEAGPGVEQAGAGNGGWACGAPQATGRGDWNPAVPETRPHQGTTQEGHPWCGWLPVLMGTGQGRGPQGPAARARRAPRKRLRLKDGEGKGDYSRRGQCRPT